MKSKLRVIFIKLKILYLKLRILISNVHTGLRNNYFKARRFFHDLHMGEYLNLYRIFVLLLSLLIGIGTITYISLVNNHINELQKDVMINIAAGALWATFLIGLVDLGYYVQRVRATQRILRLARITLGSPLYGLKTQMANFLGFKVDKAKVVELDETLEPRIRMGEYNASIEGQIDDFFNSNQFDTEKLKSHSISRKKTKSYRWQVETAHQRLERVISLYANSLSVKSMEPLLELEYSLDQHASLLKIFDDKKIVADMNKDKTTEFSDAIILVGIQERFNKIKAVEHTMELNRYYK